MDIFKSDARTIRLERYAIRRPAVGEPTRIRAWLIIETTSMSPSEMRLRVDYEYRDIPNPNEQALGQRIVHLIRDRVMV